MPLSKSLESIPFNPKIECTLTRICKEKVTMAAHQLEVPPKALRGYAIPSIDDTVLSIRRLTILAENFKIKAAIIRMVEQSVQFGGLSQETWAYKLATFLVICDTFKHNGATDDASHLHLFPFSSRDKVKAWLNFLPPRIITTWEELAQKFLTKYFFLAKMAKLRKDIISFSQFDGEWLYETWERYK